MGAVMDRVVVLILLAVSQYFLLLLVLKKLEFSENISLLEQRINPKWEVGGKVGVDYGSGGYINRKVDVGVGYNVGKDTQIRGSAGVDSNKFGSNGRVGIGINHQFGRK